MPVVLDANMNSHCAIALLLAEIRLNWAESRKKQQNSLSKRYFWAMYRLVFLGYDLK